MGFLSRFPITTEYRHVPKPVLYSVLLCSLRPSMAVECSGAVPAYRSAGTGFLEPRMPHIQTIFWGR